MVLFSRPRIKTFFGSSIRNDTLPAAVFNTNRGCVFEQLNSTNDPATEGLGAALCITGTPPCAEVSGVALRITGGPLSVEVSGAAGGAATGALLAASEASRYCTIRAASAL